MARKRAAANGLDLSEIRGTGPGGRIVKENISRTLKEKEAGAKRGDVAPETVGRDYPGIKVAGRRNGYFKEQEEEGVVRDINASRSDILFVAMSSPRKERFLAEYGGELRVPVCHGVGGSFDVYAGVVKRAPLRWQKYGFEWLYRLLQEPRRMWKRYLVTNVLFIRMLAAEYLKK